MARKLLVLAAASVVLLVYLVGRGEAPAVQCTDPARSDCIAVAVGRVTGPGTYRIAGSLYVFDVPAGRSVRVAGVRRPDYIELARRGVEVPEELREGYITNVVFVPPPIPLRSRRLSEVREHRVAVVSIEAPVEVGSAVLVIDRRTGDPLYRRIVVREENSEKEIYQYPEIRLVRDLTAHETAERFPLDRVSILPAVEVLFARTAADLLFDQIVASIRPRAR